MYKPLPIDTSDVELPDSLKPLVEALAKNVHDVWAKKRIAEGWVYGEKKDDTKKTTPCLVPYEELSESEKEYDRATAIETLKLLIKLGFDVKKVTK